MCACACVGVCACVRVEALERESVCVRARVWKKKIGEYVLHRLSHHNLRDSESEPMCVFAVHALIYQFCHKFFVLIICKFPLEYVLQKFKFPAERDETDQT